MTEALLVVAGFVGGLVLQVLAEVVLEDPLSNVVARVLGSRSRRPNKISGLWRARYNLAVDGDPAKSHGFTEWEHLSVRQFRNHVWASSSGRPRAAGKIVDGVFTGVWYDRRDNRRHHGAVQFVVHIQGDRLIGKYVGVDSDNRVNHGEWFWERLD